MSRPAAPEAQHSTAKMVAKQTERTPTLPVITIVPPARHEFRRGPDAAAHQRAVNSTTSAWNANFFDCCCSVAPTYCCVVTCCPCTTIASVKESLGGGYERTLLYFGGLAFGMMISVGFAASNNSPARQDGDTTQTPPPPPQDSGVGGSIMWAAAAVALLLVFLCGVWRLRMQTRETLGIKGSQVHDCLSSFLCCFCVISQLHLELKCQHEDPRAIRHTRHRGGGDIATNRAVDTLAPYAAM
jgi:Cys-rich protein (TIGR01571 family)